ncbi:ferritin-like domain-containing protein [Flavobacterium wongokense]|uniref:ferritin-like domain-containing protein n=1 Tax=Flavobacterium wongokense TaxID=2910674 RepID=UPI001F1EA7B9|nr:PA2169 family four-helix-bundle protein [Flavobacterium sp. WG47]MCF6132185.1 PA2169 family four-helix-bundle protein [Flavobacterium sp. WG47]
METANTIIVLNKLITINNDRIEGYQKAYDETDEQDLKTLFSGFIRNSQKCKTELEDSVNRLGGEVAEGTMTSGKFFRVWMDVKAALTGKDRKAILDSCEFGEDAAKGTYEKVLKDDLSNLSSEQQTMIRAQHTQIKADHDKVKSMRDSLVTV